MNSKKIPAVLDLTWTQLLIILSYLHLLGGTWRLRILQYIKLLITSESIIYTLGTWKKQDETSEREIKYPVRPSLQDSNKFLSWLHFDSTFLGPPVKRNWHKLEYAPKKMVERHKNVTKTKKIMTTLTKMKKRIAIFDWKKPKVIPPYQFKQNPEMADVD